MKKEFLDPPAVGGGAEWSGCGAEEASWEETELHRGQQVHLEAPPGRRWPAAG